MYTSNLQKILGKDVDSGIRTFGWSLSGGMDLDGNKYPDVLVGAYESSNAVYIRSAPVVHLDSKVHNRKTFNDKNIFCIIFNNSELKSTYYTITQVEFRVPQKQINLEQKNCKLRDGSWVTCVDIDVSMSYDGIGVPDFIGRIYISLGPQEEY